MGAQFGHVKTGGRKAGTPNKKTQEMRANIESRLGLGVEEAMLDLYAKTDDLFLKFAILKDLMPYTYPKLKPVDPDEDEADSSAKSEQAKELLALDDQQLVEKLRERLKTLISENE